MSLPLWRCMYRIHILDLLCMRSSGPSLFNSLLVNFVQKCLSVYIEYGFYTEQCIVNVFSSLSRSYVTLLLFIIITIIYYCCCCLPSSTSLCRCVLCIFYNKRTILFCFFFYFFSVRSFFVVFLYISFRLNFSQSSTLVHCASSNIYLYIVVILFFFSLCHRYIYFFYEKRARCS